MSFAMEAAKPFWEGAFVFGKRRVLRDVSLVKPPAFSLSARLKKYINDGGDSYPSLVESAQDFSDAPFLAHGSICSRNMHLFQIVSYDSLQASLSTLGMQCAYVFQIASKPSEHESNIEFLNGWHKKSLCPILRLKYCHLDDRGNPGAPIDAFIALKGSDKPNTVYALLLESPGISKQQPQQQMALINNLVIEQCRAMKNNKKNDSFDLKINRTFLKQLTCIDEGSKDGIYSMVLESELNSLLSAPRTSSKEDLDAVTKTAMWKCLRENTAFSGGRGSRARHRDSISSGTGESFDDTIASIEKHVHKCITKTFEFASEATDIVKKGSIRSEVDCAEEKYDHGNNGSDKTVSLNRGIETSGEADSNHRKRDKKLSRVSSVEKVLSSTGSKKASTSRAQAAMAGATARDRARRRERRKRGGIRRSLSGGKKLVKVQSNSSTGKLKSESITDDGSAVLKKRKTSCSSDPDVDKSGSYKKINERFIRKACKKFLNGQDSNRLKDQDSYNQILSFAFTSSIFAINAMEKGGIDSAISADKLKGIATKNCQHALTMLLSE